GPGQHGLPPHKDLPLQANYLPRRQKISHLYPASKCLRPLKIQEMRRTSGLSSTRSRPGPSRQTHAQGFSFFMTSARILFTMLHTETEAMRTVSFEKGLLTISV